MPTESDKKPTFRLYFTIKDPPGFTKKPHQPAVVTPKFYAKQAELPALMTEAELAAKIALFITEPPQKKYKNPPTENQTYGWYHQAAFGDVDSRFNFAKHTNQMIKEVLMSYQK